ncbi:membrane protein insertion efficiency factor YidD [Silvibacterium sp.]|uniref:membrane protein insertion efficiency factor YidD n=1 Tax=Silvibacterium sp. TaxID=1964179 RepID=UPI0039E22BE4
MTPGETTGRSGTLSKTDAWRQAVVEKVFSAYKLISPMLHAVSGRAGACRFTPTCSEYAAIAVSEHGLWRGGWMALRRLGRCHPLTRGGFDPVPAKSGKPGQHTGMLGTPANRNAG